MSHQESEKNNKKLFPINKNEDNEEYSIIFIRIEIKEKSPQEIIREIEEINNETDFIIDILKNIEVSR